jgi:hypothetical protein
MEYFLARELESQGRSPIVAFLIVCALGSLGSRIPGIVSGHILDLTAQSARISKGLGYLGFFGMLDQSKGCMGMRYLNLGVRENISS